MLSPLLVPRERKRIDLAQKNIAQSSWNFVADHASQREATKRERQATRKRQIEDRDDHQNAEVHDAGGKRDSRLREASGRKFVSRLPR
jgi:hypothetical protein